MQFLEFLRQWQPVLPCRFAMLSAFVNSAARCSTALPFFMPAVSAMLQNVCDVPAKSPAIVSPMVLPAIGLPL
jgi:hypothetical protein